MIYNTTQLAEKVGIPAERIARALYKGTQCGICYGTTDTGVYVCGYAEGADVECEKITLDFPFAIEQFWDAVQAADDEGCALWHEWNP